MDLYMTDDVEQEAQTEDENLTQESAQDEQPQEQQEQTESVLLFGEKSLIFQIKFISTLWHKKQLSDFSQVFQTSN